MSLIIQKPDAVLLDFDDTLVDTKPIIQKALDNTLKKYNLTQEIIKERGIDINRSLRDYFEEIFEEKLDEARNHFYSFYDQFAVNLEIFPNALQVLDFLKDYNVYTAIVSNKSHLRLKNEINNRLKLGHYFKSIVGSGEAIEDKPSAIPAKLALEKLNLDSFDNVWFIGDSFVDMETAKNLGCKAILFGTESLSQNIEIFYKTKNHAELLNLLKKTYA